MQLNRQTLRIDGIPLVLIYRDSPESAGQRGTILFYHGLSSRKEDNIKELESFAHRGFLAVGVDNVGHGERRYPDFADRMKGDRVERELLDMTRKTAEEVPGLIDELVRRGYAAEDRLGICGISMGGYIVYTALTIESRFRAAAPVLGSPLWKGIEDDEMLNLSPHKHPEKFNGIFLLSQNAGKDVSVPAHYARDFHKTLNLYYPNEQNRFKYVEFPESGHFMREQDWNILWHNVLEWFEKYLAP